MVAWFHYRESSQGKQPQPRAATVLRCLDCGLNVTKQQLLARYEGLQTSQVRNLDPISTGDRQDEAGVEDGSRIAIVCTGNTGSGESEIRRWIILVERSQWRSTETT